MTSAGEPRREALAAELGVDAAELAALWDTLTDGVAEALAGGLIRHEDALLELAG